MSWFHSLSLPYLSKISSIFYILQFNLINEARLLLILKHNLCYLYLFSLHQLHISRLVRVNHPCYIQFLEKCSLLVALFIPMNPLLMYHRFVCDNVMLSLRMKFLMSLFSQSLKLQVPWILSGTVRDNILFGKSYDPERYNAFNYGIFYTS